MPPPPPPARARIHVWPDVPAWGARTAVPLLTLPPELLDRCFGLGAGLAARDLVALAGVSKYFRTHLDDAFFRAWMACSADYRSSPLGEAASPPPLRHPFSRDVADWRVPRPPRPSSSTAVPRPGPAERSAWSPAEYRAYKHSQAAARARAKLARHVSRTKRGVPMAHPYGDPPTIHAYVRTRVLAVVDGRKAGEPGVRLDRRGRPEGAQRQAEHVRRRLDQRRVAAEHAARACEARARGEAGGGKVAGGKDAGWCAPDSDDDGEASEYDAAGRRVVHDYWPSAARARVAAIVNSEWATTGVAKCQFQLSDADLLGIKHVLAVEHYNPDGLARRRYMEAALEALALRAAAAARAGLYSPGDDDGAEHVQQDTPPRSGFMAAWARLRLRHAGGERSRLTR